MGGLTLVIGKHIAIFPNTSKSLSNFKNMSSSDFITHLFFIHRIKLYELREYK